MELMRALAVTTAAVLIVAGLAFPAAGSLGGLAPNDQSPAGDARPADRPLDSPAHSANGTASNATAGSRLSGAFATQPADLGGELETRAVTVRLARANTTTERVAELAALRSATETRLKRLERRRQRLHRALANGSLTPGEYAHRVADLRADVAVTETVADRGARAAGTLPESVATEYEVDPASFRTLQHHSQNVSAHLAVAFENESTALFGWHLIAPDPSADRFDDDEDATVPFGHGDDALDESVNETALDALLNETGDDVGDALDGFTDDEDSANDTSDKSADGTDVFDDGSDSLFGDDSTEDSTPTDDRDGSADSTPTETDDGWLSGGSEQPTASDITATPTDEEDDSLFD